MSTSLKNEPDFRVYLIRHGETEWNRLGKFQGHTDVPLNETGLHHGRRLQKFVNSAGIEAFWSSDLTRASDTAREASSHRLPLTIDARLRECRIGEGEGRTDREHRATYGDAFISGWRGLTEEAHWDLRFPGGESSREVVTRVLELFESLRTHGYRSVGVTTHGGVLKRLLKHLKLESNPPIPYVNGIVIPLEWNSEATGLAGGQWSLGNVLPIECVVR